MTAQHPREPAPCSPAVGRRSVSGGALRAARLAGLMAMCSCCVVFYAVCPSCHLIYHVPTSGSNPRPLARLRAALLSTPSCKGGVACRTHPTTAPPPLYSIRRLRCGGDGGPGNSPLHRHALPDMGRRQGGRGRGCRAPVAAGGQTCGPPVCWRGPRAQGQACLLGVCSAPSLHCLHV
jgi:hypothetical protein